MKCGLRVLRVQKSGVFTRGRTNPGTWNEPTPVPALPALPAADIHAVTTGGVAAGSTVTTPRSGIFALPSTPMMMLTLSCGAVPVPGPMGGKLTAVAQSGSLRNRTVRPQLDAVLKGDPKK